MSAEKCEQCPSLAEVRFTWPSSQGMQQANFCRPCAAEAWKKYGQTESFQSSTIEDLSPAA